MAANAYPHIVFARDTDALPQQALADILIGLFPEAHVEQGKIKAVLTLDDEYTYTFWYDEEADGLGERYADYAAPVRRRRVEKCTVMIDASGDADAGGTRARDVHRIMAALAERSGVYVFSEESARFVGMDYGDGGAIPSTQSGATPELDPRSEVSPPPSLREGSREVATEAEEMSGDFHHADQGAVDRPTDEHAPASREDTAPGYAVPPVPVSGATIADSGAQSVDVTLDEEERMRSGERQEEATESAPVGTSDDQVAAERDHAPSGARDHAPSAAREGASSTQAEETYRAEPGADHAESHTVAPAGQDGEQVGGQDRDAQVDPAREQGEQQEKPGLFKRLFGRRR